MSYLNRLNDSTDFLVTKREKDIVISKKAFEKAAGKIVSKEIQSKISKLEKQIKELKINHNQINISNSAAKKILKDAIKQFKNKGIAEIDIIDLHTKTKLPIGQIGNIMIKLENEGVVTEDG